MSFVAKAVSEQKVEYLSNLRRPLTDAESDELRRAMHAVYERTRRARCLGMHEQEEQRLLKKLEREARQASDLA
jgi:hypothetical protein